MKTIIFEWLYDSVISSALGGNSRYCEKYDES